MVIRGGVYQVDFGPISDQGDRRYRGHEQRGRRYGIVVSQTDSHLSVVTVTPTSTGAPPSVYHPEIDFDGVPTRALIEQTRAIDRRFLGAMVGYLTRDQFAEVELILAQYLGLLPPPRAEIKESTHRS